MKIHIWTIIITNFLILSIVDKSIIQQPETTLLYSTWCLKTYAIGNKEYPPKKKEKDDYIQFKKDMTFMSKSEGIEEKGTFFYNANGAYVILIAENGEKIKAYILSITDTSLVLKYDINEMRDVEVQYNKTNI